MEIHVKQLSKSYGKQKVLDQIDLQLEAGKCYGILGKNGAGKTTLLNCLSDLVLPDAGQILINGEDLQQNKLHFKSQMGLISEDNPLVKEFSGYQYLKFTGMLYQITGSELESRVQSLFDFFFEEEEAQHKAIAAYSTGMKKRLALSAAVIHKPAILILDEPFSGVDPVAIKVFIRFLKSYLTEKRLILISSHDLAYLQQLVHQIVVIHESKIIFDDRLERFTQDGQGLMDEALYQLLMPDGKSDQDIQWLMED